MMFSWLCECSNTCAGCGEPCIPTAPLLIMGGIVFWAWATIKRAEREDRRSRKGAAGAALLVLLVGLILILYLLFLPGPAREAILWG